MKYESYKWLLVSKSGLEFKFSSRGPGGTVEKLIQLTVTDNPSIYNLAFGDLLRFSGKVLFPKKLELANEVVGKLKWQ